MTGRSEQRTVGVVVGTLIEDPDGNVVLVDGHGWCFTPPESWAQGARTARRWAHIAWAGWTP